MDCSQDLEANLAAHQAVERFGADLDDDESFGGLAIVPSGLRVHVVEPPTPFLIAAVRKLRTLVPVETQPVKNSLATLNEVTRRLNQDHESWSRKGILLSGWGPDVMSNLVEVHLQKYEPQFGQALVDEYGADVLTVSTEPRIIRAL